jgi:hypothetical protein
MQDERQRTKVAVKEARVAAKVFERGRQKAEAVRERHEAQVAILEKGLSRAEDEAAAILKEHRARLAEMEARALAAERRAGSARTRVAEAHERAAEARAQAKESGRDVEASATGAARLDTERRLAAEAQRELELECAEIRSRLNELRIRVGEQAVRAADPAPSDDLPGLEEGAGAQRTTRIAAAPVASRAGGRASDRLRHLERRAAAARDRVATAERNLAREAERLKGDLDRRIAEEAGSARATMEVELAAARRQLAEARRRARAATAGQDDVDAGPPQDPLKALEASLTERGHRRDGSESMPEPSRPPGYPRRLLGRIRARLPG